MIINAEAAKALEAKDEKALAEALRADYDDAAEYLAGKLLGTITDDHILE